MRTPSSSLPTLDSGAAPVGARRVGPTCLSAQRRAGRAIASELLGVALEGRCAAVARHLAPLSADAVEHWCDPTNPSAVTLGDILAMPRGDAHAILKRALALLDDAAPTSAAAVPLQAAQAAARHGAFVGEVADAALDGRFDADEVARCERAKLEAHAIDDAVLRAMRGASSP